MAVLSVYHTFGNDLHVESAISDATFLLSFNFTS